MQQLLSIFFGIFQETGKQYLRNFPPEDSFSLAIALVLTGNFEVAHEAFQILDSVEENLDEHSVKASYDKVMAHYKNKREDEAWRKSLRQFPKICVTDYNPLTAE